jgi:hypothetical protein
MAAGQPQLLAQGDAQARLAIYHGMGHGLPQPLWPAMLDDISVLTGQRGGGHHAPR